MDNYLHFWSEGGKTKHAKAEGDKREQILKENRDKFNNSDVFEHQNVEFQITSTKVEKALSKKNLQIISNRINILNYYNMVIKALLGYYSIVQQDLGRSNTTRIKGKIFNNTIC